MTSGEAAPSAPADGSLMSIRSTPASRARLASCALRTLSKSLGILVSRRVGRVCEAHVLGMSLMGCRELCIQPVDQLHVQRLAPGAVDGNVSAAPFAKRGFDLDLSPAGLPLGQ